MAAPDASAPLTTWLTDRSRVELGLSRCARARYLTNHAGPTGYGYTLRSEALPLATGLSIHQGVERFAAILKKGALPTLEETRGVVAEVTTAHVAKVEARGYRGILGGPHTEETILEQTTLIGNELWALRLTFLEWFHQIYEVVASEEERLYPLGPGRALMLRTDLLARRRGAQTLAQFEFKTTGWESDAWAEQWETKPQLGLSTLDTTERWGAEVTEIYIVGLQKGRRMKDKYDPDGRKRQMSPLCYGYCRPGNPPLAPDDWVAAYEWIDVNGEVKRASRAHRRRGVWELAASDWPTWEAYRKADPSLTPAEFWVRWLPPNLLEKICFVLGPLNRQDTQLQSLCRSIDAEEERWQQALWQLYELQQTGAGWATPKFQAELDRLVPCSWACRPFGKEHECQFVRICYRHEGWQDPLGSGRYQPRLPHHEPERLQAVARGLIPDDAAEIDEEER